MNTSDDMPKRGLWYKLMDFSDNEFGSDWGFILYKDGEEVYRDSGYSLVRSAGDAARELKRNWTKRHNVNPR